MRSAADALAFERAAAIRQTLNRAAGAASQPAFRHATDLATGGWLIILPAGPKRNDPSKRRLSSFVLRGGRLFHGPGGTAAELDALCERWCAMCEPTMAEALESAMPDEEDAARSEAVWLAGKFLFQDERAPGMFVSLDGLPGATELAWRVRARFELTGTQPTDTSGHSAD